jgi:hypothetical protein
MYVRMYMCMYICVYACMHVCMYVCIGSIYYSQHNKKLVIMVLQRHVSTHVCVLNDLSEDDF